VAADVQPAGARPVAAAPVAAADAPAAAAPLPVAADVAADAHRSCDPTEAVDARRQPAAACAP